MATYLTVDSGSTNTRITLMVDGAIADTYKFTLAISETKSRQEMLSLQLKEGIEEILRRNNVTPEDVTRIIACGMITSEFGLIKLDHIIAPAGIKELAQNLYEVVFGNISPIPFVFVRGVKYLADEHIDMMRGEETEIYGISENPEEGSLYVLPGSHSKLIFVDQEKRIADFSTELTGELISAVANHTILSGIIDLNNSEIDADYLQKGYLFSRDHGMNAALFKIRSLKLFAGCSSEELFSYFIGVVLAPEVANIINSGAAKVIVGGKMQLKKPVSMLVEMNSDKNVEMVPEEVADFATAYGCVRIYEESLKL